MLIVAAAAARCASCDVSSAGADLPAGPRDPVIVDGGIGLSNTASDDQRSEGHQRASQDERDRQAAQKLLKLLKDNPDVSCDMSTLRQCFGVKRFTAIRKAEVERALAEAGIKVTPSLQSPLRSKRLISLGTVDAPGETDSNGKGGDRSAGRAANDLGGKTESHRNRESLMDRIKRHDLRVLAWVSAILALLSIWG